MQNDVVLAGRDEPVPRHHADILAVDLHRERPIVFFSYAEPSSFRLRAELRDALLARHDLHRRPDRIESLFFHPNGVVALRDGRGNAWLWIAVAAALALIAVVLGLLSLGGDGKPAATPSPAPIEAPVRGATPADEARNLSAWLRRHSR